MEENEMLMLAGKPTVRVGDVVITAKIPSMQGNIMAQKFLIQRLSF